LLDISVGNFVKIQPILTEERFQNNEIVIDLYPVT